MPKTSHEKALQRALIQYRKPANYDLVREALVKAGRTDSSAGTSSASSVPSAPRSAMRTAAPRKERGGALKSAVRSARERTPKDVSRLNGAEVR